MLIIRKTGVTGTWRKEIFEKRGRNCRMPTKVRRGMGTLPSENEMLRSVAEKFLSEISGKSSSRPQKQIALPKFQIISNFPITLEPLFSSQ